MPPSRYVRLTDQPQVIIFEPLPPTHSEGQYGPKVEYAVNGNQILSASTYLADQIEAGRDPNSRTALSIRMYKQNNRTRYDIENVAQGGYQQQPQQAPRSNASTQRMPVPMLPAPAAPQRTFEDIERDLEYCLSVGLSIAGNHLGENFTTEDARSLGTTLFIEANRSGVKIPRFTERNLEVERDTPPPYEDGDYPEEFPEEPPFEVPPRRR